jgi:DNA polymerase I-like protein with 3'-5' exonuclease and polymerase domains
MSTPKPITIDFETEGIERRPAYPPVPVGFSIKGQGDKKSRYYAWGHPTANNCTKAQARQVLLGAWRSGEQLLFQYAKFDVDVAQTHMGMPKIEWNRIEDTLYLLFLHDPYAASLSLKPAAQAILGMKPTERDNVNDWILANVNEAKRKPSTAGAYICLAPGDLVGRYADGDVLRTERLFNKLHKEICARGMQASYDRERHLMPIMLENERDGVNVDLPALQRDISMYQQAIGWCDEWLRKKLKAPNLNIDADADMADALDKAGIVTDWVLTKTGKRSIAKKNMTIDMFNHKATAAIYGYRSRLATCLSMFMLTWLDMAQASGGRIFTNWNQVRQTHGNEKGAGARTGRFSSNPSFMNIPKVFGKQKDADFGPYLDFLAKAFPNLPPLPRLRKYWLPDKGDTWGRRDYNQQELRLLAHFEDGDLMRAYNDDPRLDIHTKVQEAIEEITGIHLDRDPVKILNFADIYGRGLGELAIAMNVDVRTAAEIRAAKNQYMPGVAQLAKLIVAHAKRGLPIRTWGGREYFVEPAKFSKKFQRVMEFYYKLLNYLIQGSAADVTKESIIRYHEHPKREGRFLLTVHDENNISAAHKRFKQEMLLLRECMQSVEVDVPMLSDGEGGPNWGTLEKLKEA